MNGGFSFINGCFWSSWYWFVVYIAIKGHDIGTFSYFISACRYLVVHFSTSVACRYLAGMREVNVVICLNHKYGRWYRLLYCHDNTHSVSCFALEIFIVFG